MTCGRLFESSIHLWTENAVLSIAGFEWPISFLGWDGREEGRAERRGEEGREYVRRVYQVKLYISYTTIDLQECMVHHNNLFTLAFVTLQRHIQIEGRESGRERERTLMNREITTIAKHDGITILAFPIITNRAFIILTRKCTVLFGYTLCLDSALPFLHQSTPKRDGGEGKGKRALRTRSNHSFSILSMMTSNTS